jgi:DNA-binding SARP family transcriptional activator
MLAQGDEVDVQRFERVVAASRADGPSARSRKLREDLTLFRGEPLSDFRYVEFAAAEAVRLDELRHTVVEEQIDAELKLGGHAEVIPQLERLVVDHPLEVARWPPRFGTSLLVGFGSAASPNCAPS